jgi:fatty acid desaturase
VNPEDESPWQRAYDASIAEEAARSADEIESLDPAWRWSMAIRARLRLAVYLVGFAALGVVLLVRGPWYVSVIGVMLLLGAVLASVGVVVGRIWKLR